MLMSAYFFIFLFPRSISCAAARLFASFVREQSVQQSRLFLRRRAPHPIIETQTRFTLWVSMKNKKWCFSFYLASKKCHFQIFFALKQVFFPTASPPDEALHVFAFFPAAGVPASRRRAGRARRHRPVCWSELASRQVHEADARSAQPAAALGTSSSGPHHEPPRAPAGHQLAAPGLVATRRSHRPAAHTRGARPHQDSPYRHSRASNPQPLHSLKTSPAAVGRSAARSRSTPSPATGSSTCWASGRPRGDGTCGGACARSSTCAPGCSTGSTRTLLYRWKRSTTRGR